MKKCCLFVFVFAVMFNSCIDEQVIVDNIPKPNGILFVDSQPDSAEIFFLGTDTGKLTPDSLVGLETGTYDVTLKLKDYKDTTFFVTVLNNYKTTRMIKLIDITSLGKIILNSDPAGAQIFLLGNNTNKFTPDSITNLNPGNYSLSLKLDGFRDTSFLVTVLTNQAVVRSIVLQDTLPVIDSEIQYRKIQFGQILFSFKFNQDIYLTKIETTRPGSAEVTTNDFADEFIEKDEEVVLIFAGSQNGIWEFTIFGTKAAGDQKEFELVKEVEVE